MKGEDNLKIVLRTFLRMTNIKPKQIKQLKNVKRFLGIEMVKSQMQITNYSCRISAKTA
jgi:hypothetical protein